MAARYSFFFVLLFINGCAQLPPPAPVVQQQPTPPIVLAPSVFKDDTKPLPQKQEDPQFEFNKPTPYSPNAPDNDFNIEK